MINASDRKKAVELIETAVKSGAQLIKACGEINISKRTFNRWKSSNTLVDKRITCERPVPANKLSQDERKKIIETLNSPEYRGMPPSQIFQKLADKGIYLASERTMYRVRKEDRVHKHSGTGFVKPSPERSEIVEKESQ